MHVCTQVPLFVRWEDYVPRYLRRVDNVFVVQIGANCGKNTYGCASGGCVISAFEHASSSYIDLC